MQIDMVSKIIAGLCVGQVVKRSSRALEIWFTDGRCLLIRQGGAGLTAAVHGSAQSGRRPRDGQPSARQREYLQFIMRYAARHGIAPSESDIQQHFLVSAPSVNNMMQTLERRGFISRDRDWTGQAAPRSIRVLVDLA